jgi:hypothetical protein
MLGVVFGCERTVGESIGPMLCVGANESPQAVSNSRNSMRNGKPNRDRKDTPNPRGDRKGTPLLDTTCAVAPYLLTSEGFANVGRVITSDL